MKINFERSGGFANLQLSTSVDTEKLPEKQSADLNKLVEAAKPFTQSSAQTPAQNMPDQCQYKITFEKDNQTHTIETTDNAASEDLFKLIEWLNDRAFSEKQNQLKNK